MPTLSEVLIGTGQLTWARHERVSDRYGTVQLFSEGEVLPLEGSYHAGKTGHLVVEVLETRQSEHVGDLFRGIFPTTPSVGDQMTLGEGKLFFDSDEDGDVVGVEPADGRDSDWMNPKTLYRAHQQTVRLIFVPNHKG